MSNESRPFTFDVDGVLFNYHDSYAKLWQRVFGTYPAEIDPDAYWAMHRYDVRMLEGAEKEHFNSFKDEEFWTTFTPIEDALEACYKIKELYPNSKLIAVSALPPEANKWRTQNLLDLKFPMDECIATGTAMATPTISPKAFVLNKIIPLYHVDDHLPYFQGLNPVIRRALIHRNAHDRRSSNHDPLMLAKTNSRHKDLKGFANWLESNINKTPLPR